MNVKCWRGGNPDWLKWNAEERRFFDDTGNGILRSKVHQVETRKEAIDFSVQYPHLYIYSKEENPRS